MVGSDVVVAWLDQASGKGFAEDYYLDDKAQCTSRGGSCPDTVQVSEHVFQTMHLIVVHLVNGSHLFQYYRLGSNNLFGCSNCPLNISIDCCQI